MAAPKIVLSPSLMCADLLNLSDAVKALEEIGVDALHIDLIDSASSPSMPLGLETIKQLRKATNLPFDIHIMSMNNEWFYPAGSRDWRAASFLSL
ncbi:ribulose-phosphate 3-epimerase [Escherichia coli]|nr:ribulose-phosphate 3-epimerase [Escherichia coli]